MNAQKPATPNALHCKNCSSGCCQTEEELSCPPLPSEAPSLPSGKEKEIPPYYHREIF